MLSMILLQVAAGASLAKVGAAIGAGLAAIGAGCYCPPTGTDREYSDQYDCDCSLD